MMKMKADEILAMRKRFFNEHADKWLDMWYKDEKSGRYDKHDKDFNRLFSLIRLRKGDKVLDAGCGTGILVPYILPRIGDEGILYELDFAEKMIEVNRCLHTAANIRFIVSEAEYAPLEDESCDVIVCFSCFPHFEDKRQAVSRLAGILKQGGLFVVSHFDSSEGINKHHASCHAVKHDHLPEEAEMRSIFSHAGLRIESFTDEPGFYLILAVK